MAKKKPKPVKTETAPQPARSGKTVNVWIDPDLHAVLAAYLRDQRPKPTITSVVETALEDFLRGKGYTRQSIGGVL